MNPPADEGPDAVDPDALERRLREGPARLAVVGMGYVGLPLALAAAEVGLHVLGFDVDAPKVVGLNAGHSPLEHVGHVRVAAARALGRLEATGEPERLASADAILICVPTPLGPHREPDLSFVEGTGRTIAAVLRRGQLVILESTTYPGTTRDVLLPLLEAGSSLRAGRDFWLAYSPEREDPGNREHTTATIPKVVGGLDAVALRLAMALYGRFVARTVPVSSLEAAEETKLAENVFRAVNIALANELKLVLDAMGVDVFEVIAAAATKPFGYMPFWPGPGLGGHCIPIDPFYLAWKAKEAGRTARLVELAGEVNAAMPAWVVGRLAEAIDRRTGKGLKGARVLLVGVAYKRDVDDVRESPALEIISLLEDRGAEVLFHDPHVAAIPRTRRHPGLAGREGVTLAAPLLAGLDAALVVTDHAAVDWALLAAHAPLVVDTRDALRRRGLGGPNLVMA